MSVADFLTCVLDACLGLFEEGIIDEVADMLLGFLDRQVSSRGLRTHWRNVGVVAADDEHPLPAASVCARSQEGGEISAKSGLRLKTHQLIPVALAGKAQHGGLTRHMGTKARGWRVAR